MPYAQILLYDYHSGDNCSDEDIFYISSLIGWEDVSLASEGVMEAMAAGKLLKEHGFTFDVVYTR